MVTRRPESKAMSYLVKELLSAGSALILNGAGFDGVNEAVIRLGLKNLGADEFDRSGAHLQLLTQVVRQPSSLELTLFGRGRNER